MHRVYNLLILLSFFLCYFSYGKAGDGFIGLTEFYVLTDFNSWPDFLKGLLFFSPIFIGQIILLAAAFRAQPNKKLTIAGIILPGIVVVLVFLAGLVELNIGAIISTLPYFICSVIGIIKVPPVVKDEFEIH